MLLSITIPRAAFLAMTCFVALAASGQELTADAASAVFDRAHRIASQDAGAMWGRSLAGPIVLVDRATRSAVTSGRVDGFVGDHGVWIGTLPDSLVIANTALSWGGKDWTMLMWPVPSDTTALNRLLAHELWHRVQSALGFPSTGPSNEHLADRDGRYWLTLEFRALAEAVTNPGASQPALDALSFRAERHRRYPTAADQERALIMHEGLAEYTGFAMSGAGTRSNHRVAAAALTDAEEADSFVRMFAYPLGAGYGLVLDAREPGWQRTANASEDLGDRLLARMATELPDPSEAASRYDGDTLAQEEDRLEVARKVVLEAQTRRYVTGPRLILAFHQMNVSFDPGGVDVLPGQGSIYPALTLTDEWGILRVTGGALIRSDWSGVVVPGPNANAAGGNRLLVEGDGYVLELAPKWMLTPGPDAATVIVVKRN